MAMNIFEALQAPFRQGVEVFERSSSVSRHSGDVEEIDPPDDLDELYYDVYGSVGIVNANIDTYVADVFEPGVRVRADSEATETFFEEEFLPNVGVIGGETHRHFEQFAPITETQRVTRGTALVNLLPKDEETAIPETEVIGLYHIPPETVTPLAYEGKNILIDPEDTDPDDISRTQRGETAAYAQFDDTSILGRRGGGFDRDTVYLSQTDVRKATYNLDIGGDGSDETGIWGQSALRPIKEEAAEYEEAKRDRATAIKTKAHGIWTAKFGKEVLEFPNGDAEVWEWDGQGMDDVMSELESMKAGDVLEIDGPMEPDRWEGSVPDLDDTLQQLVDDILAPLPAPKYAVGFEQDINQFVSEQQETNYRQTVQNARRYHETFWTDIFRDVAESHGFDPSGLEVTIQPQEDESPIMSLSDEQIDRIETFAGAMADLFGPGGAPSYVDDDVLLRLVLQLPEDATLDAEGAEKLLDESDPEVQAQFDALTNGTE
jgi:hypothetical protein